MKINRSIERVIVVSANEVYDALATRHDFVSRTENFIVKFDEGNTPAHNDKLVLIVTDTSEQEL